MLCSYYQVQRCKYSHYYQKVQGFFKQHQKRIEEICKTYEPLIQKLSCYQLLKLYWLYLLFLLRQHQFYVLISSEKWILFFLLHFKLLSLGQNMLPLLLCQQKEIDNWEMNCYKESSQKQTQVQLALEVIFAHLKQYKRPRKCKRHKKVDDLTIGKAPLILIKHFFDFWICFQLHNDELCDEKKSKVDQQHKEGLSIRYLDIRRNPESQCLCSCHLFKAQRIELQLKS